MTSREGYGDPARRIPQRWARLADRIGHSIADQEVGVRAVRAVDVVGVRQEIPEKAANSNGMF